MSFALLGGILLIVGAFLVFKGEIFKSVSVYLAADVCWILMAFQNKDYIGAIFIIIGMTLGLLAYLKMNKGQLHKTLHKDRDE